MSIPQLKNPKQLSYSGMRKQVRELARRMNILTEMRTVSVEPTATAKFTFSGDDATLDVPSVEEAVGLLECEEELAEAEEALAEAEEALAEAEAKIDCFELLITPPDYGGTAAWSKSYSSYKPDYGIPNQPACTKVIKSVFKVEYLGGIQLRFTRNNTFIPSSCLASGTISIGFNSEADGTGGNLPIGWNSGPGESFSTVNVTLDSTYYVFVAGLNLNENSPPTAYSTLGSFYVSPTGEISRTIDTEVSVTDGILPCV